LQKRKEEKESPERKNLQTVTIVWSVMIMTTDKRRMELTGNAVPGEGGG
jgi:hypothetical protein